jgi:hypothetical protein
MTVGHIEQTAIANSAAGSDFRKMIKPSGSQASGEIGRSTCMIGSKMRVRVFDIPSRKPSGVPIAMPSANPRATRIRL